MSPPLSRSRCAIFTSGTVLIVLALLKWTNLKQVAILSVSTELDGGMDKQSDSGHLTKQSSDSRCEPIPKHSILQAMSREQVAQLYHSYVNGIQMPCGKVVRHGNVGDGGWDVCVDPAYSIQKPCNIYSFGINNDWSFDDSVALKYGCEVHSYDPSMNVKDHDRKKNLHFHKTGLNTTDETNKHGWRMRTFKSILAENGHSEATVDLLKIDIDYSEWWAFPEMLKSGALKNVKQFSFEIHVKLNSLPEPDKDMYIKGLNLLRDIYHAGFRIYRTHRNMDAKFTSKFGVKRTGCHELYMLKNTTKVY